GPDQGGPSGRGDVSPWLRSRPTRARSGSACAGPVGLLGAETVHVGDERPEGQVGVVVEPWSMGQSRAQHWEDHTRVARLCAKYAIQERVDAALLHDELAQAD